MEHKYPKEWTRDLEGKNIRWYCYRWDSEGKGEKFTIEQYKSNPEKYEGAPLPPKKTGNGRRLRSRSREDRKSKKPRRSEIPQLRERSSNISLSSQEINAGGTSGTSKQGEAHDVGENASSSNNAKHIHQIESEHLKAEQVSKSSLLSEPSFKATADEPPLGINTSITNICHQMSSDTLQEISRQVTEALPASERRNFDASFAVKWDLFEYWKNNLGERRDLTPVLTVSGSEKNAYAATCGEYLKMCWPDLGLELLQIIERSMTEDHPSLEKRGHVKLSIAKKEAEGGAFNVYASGPKEVLISIAQQLAWLAASFRKPSNSRLASSSVSFKHLPKNNETWFRIQVLELESIGEADKMCWHPMFSNYVIARGFPIPERDFGNGVELPFNLMATLGRIWYPTEYLDHVLLKGFSTILVPVLRKKDSIQWHFISNSDQEEPISTEAMEQYCNAEFKSADLQLMKEMRTFLGWCKTAGIYLGTKGSGYDKITASGAVPAGTEARLSREFSLGKGFFDFNLGAKIVLDNTTYAELDRDDRLLVGEMFNSKRDVTLLYDLGTRQGWLVSQLSVNLHLVHAWASTQFDKETLSPKIPHANVSSNGGEAAHSAVKEHATLELREAYASEERLFLLDIMKSMYKAMRSRKEAVFKKKSESFRIPGLPTLSATLYGWDFTEITNVEGIPTRRKVTINQTSGGWESIIDKNPKILVLFCRNLGNPIRPVDRENLCTSWTPTPLNKDYLTASIPCIHALTKIHSGEDGPPRLTSSHYCHKSPEGQLFEPCRFDAALPCNRLLQLHPTAPSDLLPLFSEGSNGAVIVGQIKLSKRPLCKPLPAIPDDQHASRS